MQIIRSKWSGDYDATEATTVHGMIVGDVVVRPGVTMIVHGMVCGDLVAQAGSTVRIAGMVNGVVRNLGADVLISGMVDSLDDQAEPPTRVTADAVVRSASA